MTLLVRDEEDILEAHLRYHLEQGVDFIIATDNLSVDGTSDILRRFELDGVLEVIEEHRDNYDQGRWVSRMARKARVEHAADWVINSDADEFWWPSAGDLASTFAAIPRRVGVVSVDRSDFVPVAEDDRPFHERMTARKVTSLSFEGQPLGPKVAHRGRRTVVVGQGNHAVRWPKMKTMSGNVPLEILHFPLRTFSQFENKIVNGGRAYRRNTRLPVSAGSGWRTLYDLHELAELPQYYGNQEMTTRQIDEAVAAGELMRDERLRRFFDVCDRSGAN